MPGGRRLATVTDLDELPARLSLKDMCAIFGYSPSGFWRQVQAGAFDRFELRPKIGAGRSWSKARVKRYLEQEG